MKIRSLPMLLILAVVLCGSQFAWAALHEQNDDKDSAAEKGREVVAVHGSDNEHISIRMDENNTITIIAGDHSDSAVWELDLDGLGEAIDLALVEVSEVIEDLDDMQLDLRLGRDNRFLLDFDDQRYEVDLEEIMYEIGDVIDEVFEELEMDLDDLDMEFKSDLKYAVDSHLDDSGYVYDEEDEEILAEIVKLQEEIDALKKDLRSLKGRRSR